MYCGSKEGQHTPEWKLWKTMGPGEVPLCSFCGTQGHWADNCTDRQRVFQEQQQFGHLCTFCGSQEHLYLNCVLYQEILKKQKYNVNMHNEGRYKTAVVGNEDLS